MSLPHPRAFRYGLTLLALLAIPGCLHGGAASETIPGLRESRHEIGAPHRWRTSVAATTLAEPSTRLRLRLRFLVSGADAGVTPHRSSIVVILESGAATEAAAAPPYLVIDGLDTVRMQPLEPIPFAAGWIRARYAAQLSPGQFVRLGCSDSVEGTIGATHFVVAWPERANLRVLAREFPLESRQPC